MGTESLEDELERLRKEERTRLHADLARLSTSIDNLSIKVSGLAHQADMEKLSDRVLKLENYKWLIIGGIGAVAGLQGLQAFLQWFVKTPIHP